MIQASHSAEVEQGDATEHVGNNDLLKNMMEIGIIWYPATWPTQDGLCGYRSSTPIPKSCICGFVLSQGRHLLTTPGRVEGFTQIPRRLPSGVDWPRLHIVRQRHLSHQACSVRFKEVTLLTLLVPLT